MCFCYLLNFIKYIPGSLVGWKPLPVWMAVVSSARRPCNTRVIWRGSIPTFNFSTQPATKTSQYKTILIDCSLVLWGYQCSAICNDCLIISRGSDHSLVPLSVVSGRSWHQIWSEWCIPHRTLNCEEALKGCAKWNLDPMAFLVL